VWSDLNADGARDLIIGTRYWGATLTCSRLIDDTDPEAPEADVRGILWLVPGPLTGQRRADPTRDLAIVGEGPHDLLRFTLPPPGAKPLVGIGFNSTAWRSFSTCP
jgi:hypothetical protein